MAILDASGSVGAMSNARIVLSSRVNLVINSSNAQASSQSNANANINLIEPIIPVRAIAQSSGYFDPTLSSIRSISISSNLIANTNSKEFLRFQTILLQNINAISNGATGSLKHINIVSMQQNVVSNGISNPVFINPVSPIKALGQSSGYFDTTLISVLTPLSISSNAIANSNSNSKLTFISILNQISESQVNTFEKFNFQTVIKQSINSTTYANEKISAIFNGKSSIAINSFGYFDPLLYANTATLSLIGGSKSNASEKFSLIEISSPYSTNNVLKNTFFNTPANWYSLGGSSDTTDLIPGAINGNSLITVDTDTGANSGIYQPFVSIGQNYNFSAYVMNLAGSNPRTMYLQIIWSDGTISTGDLTAIDVSNGWVRLSLNATGPIGNAAAYIVTSNPGGSELGDSAAISNVLLETSLLLNTYSPATFPLGNIAIIKSNSAEKFIFKTNLIQQIGSVVNTNINPILKINLSGIAQGNAEGYIDPFVSPVGNFTISSLAIGESNLNSRLITVFAPSVVIKLAQVNATEKFVINNKISQSISSISYTNSNPSFVYNGKSFASVVSSGYLDPTVSSIGLFSLSLNISSRSDAREKFDLIQVIEDLDNNIILNAYIKSNSMEKFVFNNNLSEKIESNTNSKQNVVFNSRLYSSINTNVSGFIDPSIFSIGLFTISSNAISSPNGNSRFVVVNDLLSGIPAYAIANSNLSEKIVFNNKIVQSINSSAITLSNPSFITKIINSAQTLGTGYFDPTLSSTNNIAINANAIGLTNSKELIRFIQTIQPTDVFGNFTLNSAGVPNLKENARYISVIPSQIESVVNNKESISFVTRIVSAINTSSQGYVDPLVYSILTNSISASAFGKSGSREAFSLIEVAVPNQPEIITDPIILDGSFELGQSKWTGINNTVSISNTSSFDGAYSLLTQDLITYDEYPSGPIGAKTEFIAVANRTYNLSAYVQNVLGATPRNMYAQIIWANGIVSQGQQVVVDTSSGWVQVNVTADSPIAGKATVYIVTSTPFNSFAGDIATIDGVSLNIFPSTLPALTLNAAVNSNTKEKFVFTNTIKNVLDASPNSYEALSFNTRIQSRVNAEATGYFDSLVSSINNIGIVAIASAQPNGRAYLDPIVLPVSGTAISQSNSRDNLRFISLVPNYINAITNSYESLSFNTRIQARINASVYAIADLSTTGLLLPIVSYGFAKSGAKEGFALIAAGVPNQITQISGEQILDGSVEYGLGLWSGINNPLEQTDTTAYSGTYSILVKNSVLAYSEYESGPLGAKHDFNVTSGATYTLSGYVNNLSGANPRGMYAQIIWSNGTISQGQLTYVDSSNGWTQIFVTATAPLTGNATAYIITSTPFDSFAGDISAIDNVSVVVSQQDFNQLTLNLIAKVNTREKIVFTNVLSSIIDSNANSYERAIFNTRIQSAINAQATGYIDPLLTSINNIRIVAIVSAQPSGRAYLDPITLSVSGTVISQSNSRDNLRFISSISNVTNAIANSYETLLFNTRIQARANASVYAIADLSTTGLLLPISLNAQIKSGAKEGFALIAAGIPNQVTQITGEQILDGSVEYGLGLWSGINNPLEQTDISSYSGTYGILIKNSVLAYSEYESGPLGAKHSFDVIAGATYTLSGYVNNISGTNPRSMYAQIIWSNGIVSQGQLTSVDSANGWTQLSITATAPLTGSATAYIVTSTPFDSFAGDITIVDNVSVVVSQQDFNQLTLNLIAKVNTREKLVFTNVLSSIIDSNANSYESLLFNTRIQSRINAEASGYIDPLISSINNIGLILNISSQSSGKAYLDSITLPVSGTVISQSNSKDNLRFISPLSIAAEAQSNSAEKIVPLYRIVSSINAISTGLADLSTTGSNLPIALNGFIKSGARESFSSIYVTIPSQKPPVYGEQLIDGSFEYGLGLWTSVNNNLSISSDIYYDGISSLLVQNPTGAYQEYETGPIGAKHDFIAQEGYKYNLSAYVNNISGQDTRDMYVQIVWANGIVSQGVATSVSTANGWTQVSLSATAPISGLSTVYIITSTPFDSFAGNVSAIDSVSLTIDNTAIPQLSLNLITKSNARDKFVFNSVVSSLIESNSNSYEKMLLNSRIFAQVQGQSSGYIDPLLSSINNVILTLSAGSKSNGYVISSNTIQISSDLINRISISNAKETFRNVSPISLSVQSQANTLERFIVSYKINAFINAQSSLNADLSTTGQILTFAATATIKSNAVETFSINYPLVPQQPDITGNIIKNGSFEFDTLSWSGILNNISLASTYAYDGSNSLLIQALNTYDGELVGPLGAKQDFLAFAGRTYNLSAQLQNISDIAPRNMYIAIKWANNTISKSQVVPVSNSNGWVGFTLSAISPINGIATVYIVTSDPLDGLLGDISVIDSVSLTVDNALPITLNLISKPNGNERFKFISSLSQSVNSIINGNSSTSSVIRISPLFANAESSSYLDLYTFNAQSLSISSSIFAKVVAASTPSFVSDLQNINVLSTPNAKERISLQTILSQSSNAIVNGNSSTYSLMRIPAMSAGTNSSSYFDFSTNSILPTQSIGKLNSFSNSFGISGIGFVYPSQIQPMYIAGNLLSNTSFELDSNNWSGILNSYSRTDAYSTDGSYSALVSNIQTYDEELSGPLGIKQDFIVFANATYTFAADVQNISGTTPRTMYLQFVWPNGKVTQSTPQLIDISNGWVNLSFTSQSPTSGYATAYVVTSSPLDSMVGDSAVIDNVSVTMNVPAQVNTNIFGTSSSREKISFNTNIIQSSASDINALFNPRFINKINATSSVAQAGALIDFTVTPFTIYTPISSRAFVSTDADIQISTISDIQNLNAGISHGSRSTFRFVSGLTSQIAISNANSIEGISVKSKINGQVQTSANGFADIGFLSQTNLKASLNIKSGADAINTMVFDLQNLSVASNHGSKSTFKLVSSVITQTAIANANNAEKISFVTRVYNQAQASVNGFADIGFLSQTNLKASLNVKSGADAINTMVFDLQNLNAASSHNARIITKLISSSISSIAIVDSNSAEKISFITRIYNQAQASVNGFADIGFLSQTNLKASINVASGATAFNAMIFDLQNINGSATHGSKSSFKLISSSISQIAVINSNAAEKISFITRVAQAINAQSSSNIDVSTTGVGAIKLSASLNAKVSAREGFGFIDVIVSDLDSLPLDNIIINGSFESDTGNWSGISNNISLTTDVYYDGLSSLLVSDVAGTGLVGARQDFKSVIGRTYTLSAYVQNISGQSRQMYAEIIWPNGKSSVSPVSIVNVDGTWSQILVSGVAQQSGLATVYIVTASPDSQFENSVSAIDNVSLTIAQVPPVTLNIISNPSANIGKISQISSLQGLSITAQSDAREKFDLIEVIQPPLPVSNSVKLYLQVESNASEAISVVNKLKEIARATSAADITQIPVFITGVLWSTSSGKFTSNIISSVQSDAIADSNGLLRVLRVNSTITPISAGMTSNAGGLVGGKPAPFDPSLIIPQFSKGTNTRSGAIENITLESRVISSTNNSTGALLSTSAFGDLGQLNAFIKSNGAGRVGGKPSPFEPTLVIPTQISAAASVSYQGFANADITATTGDFIGWGQPI